jgi:hypothetical protein
MMSNARRYCSRLGTAAAVLALLAGCGTAAIDMIPSRMGGLPQNAPERPAAQPAYPAINDTQFERDDKPLTAEEQKKLEADLAALRKTQADRLNPPAPPPKAKQPAKQLTKRPTKQEPVKQSRQEAPPVVRNP